MSEYCKKSIDLGPQLHIKFPSLYCTYMHQNLDLLFVPLLCPVWQGSFSVICFHLGLHAQNLYLSLHCYIACRYEFQMQFGSIGWSVGATLGYAQALKGKKRVIASIGDGSFQVTAQVCFFHKCPLTSFMPCYHNVLLTT